MAAPTLETDGTILRITSGTSGDPVTLNDVWDWDDGGGSSGGDGDIPIDGGGTEKVSAYLTEHVADGVYQVHKAIRIGNGSDASYFCSVNEAWYFDDGISFPDVRNFATLQSGRMEGDYGVDGSYWNFGLSVDTTIMSGQTTATLKLYNTHLRSRTRKVLTLASGTVDFNKVVYSALGRSITFASSLQSLSINGYYTVHSNYGISIDKEPTVCEDVHGHWCHYGAFSTTSVTLTNPRFTEIFLNSIVVLNAATLTQVDAKEAVNTPFLLSAGSVAVDSYSVNIHVNDADGANLALVTVVADSFGNIVSADAGSTFYRCIVDHTSGVFADDLAAGKWELTTAANAALAGVAGGAGTGAWVTGIAYVKLAHEFSVATDANGDIAEQTLTRKQWVGTSEALLSYAPYKFGFVKAGYQSLTLENIEIDAATVWTQELQDISSGASTGPIDQQWIR